MDVGHRAYLLHAIVEGLVSIDTLLRSKIEAIVCGSDGIDMLVAKGLHLLRTQVVSCDTGCAEIDIIEAVAFYLFNDGRHERMDIIGIGVEDLHGASVVSCSALPSGEPHKAFAVLIDIRHRHLRQSLLHADMAEEIVLRLRRAHTD